MPNLQVFALSACLTSAFRGSDAGAGDAAGAGFESFAAPPLGSGSLGRPKYTACPYTERLKKVPSSPPLYTLL